MFSKDLGTTILGLIIAAATAAMPIVEVAQGDWTGQNILQLVSAIGIAVFGYLTNKSEPAITETPAA